MDPIDGEPQGSFLQGLFFGVVGSLLLIYLFIPESVVFNAYKLFSYEDSIHCKKRYDLGDRSVSCQFDYPELNGIKKVFCYSKKSGLNCQIHADKDFVTPEYLKDLL